VLDSNEELVMVVGLVALSRGNGELELEAIFGCDVLDSNDDELTVPDDVMGTWVVLDTMVFCVVALGAIFGWGVLVNTEGLWDCPNTVLIVVVVVNVVNVNPENRINKEIDKNVLCIMDERLWSTISNRL
jgi:hypothetical protein